MVGRKSVHDDGTTPTLLFGVQIGVRHGGGAPIRKTKSDSHLLSLTIATAADESGYLTESESHLKKREIGKPWSEEEHRAFLEGLKKLGKGDWKGISTQFVPSRNSTQVASHAQKYFIRLNMSADTKRQRRSSVFDISLTNQPSQGSQSNNADIANSSSAASTDTVIINVDDEPDVVMVRSSSNPSIQNHATMSEMPPISPIKRDLHRVIYHQPNVSKVYQTHAVMPRISWVPVVNYSYENVVYLPDSNGSYTAAHPVMPWPSQDAGGWHGFKQVSREAPSTKNNEELKLTLGI